MSHLHMGQPLDGLNAVTTQVKRNKGGKMDVSDLLHHRCPYVIIYIIRRLHNTSTVTPH